MVSSIATDAFSTVGAGMPSRVENDPSTADPDPAPPEEPQHSVHSEPEEPADGEDDGGEGSPDPRSRD